MNDTEKYNGAGAMTSREGFSEQSIETTGSTMEAVLAARERAQIESQFTIAKRFPRNMDKVRTELLKAIERPGFADADIDRGHGKQPGSAWYKLPYGDNAEGFSVWFAEEVLRVMGNLDVSSEILWDDPEKRIIKVTVFDYERNISIPKQIVIEKTVERKYQKKDRRGKIEPPIRTRVTSSGDVNYIYPAEEHDVLQKGNALESKALRNAIMRLVPGDIQAECRRRIMQIRHGDAARNPDGDRKKMIDTFATINVNSEDLEEYTDFALSKLTTAQIDHLRDLYKAIKTGKTTWQAVITEVREERGETDKKSEKTGKPVYNLKKEYGKIVTTEENPEVTKEKQELGGLQQQAIGLAKKLYGEDKYLHKLSELCRNAPDGKFGITSATKEQAQWAIRELSDMLAAIIDEKEK